MKFEEEEEEDDDDEEEEEDHHQFWWEIKIKNLPVCFEEKNSSWPLHIVFCQGEHLWAFSMHFY